MARRATALSEFGNGNKALQRHPAVKYAEPRDVTNVDECRFYHHMDLPGLKEVGKGWDLHKTVDQYLGGFDFRGKRVLDVGTGSGFLTFEMEKRGAEVVSFDMASSVQWQLVPFGAKGFDIAQAQANMETGCGADSQRLLAGAPSTQISRPRLLRGYLQHPG